jgi:zinc transport system substrate-binding protein
MSIALIGACGKETPVDRVNQNTAIKIVAINSPLHYFAERLAGDWANVTLPVPADIDPSEWRPTVKDILDLQQADMIILNGAGYSSWLDKVAMSPRKLVDTTAAAQSSLIKIDQETTHSHGPRGDHSHGNYATTTWMDLELAQQQASAIARAMVQRWPERRALVEIQQASLLKELAALDSQYANLAIRLAGRLIIYSHPVYQYFERRYGLSGRSLHWEPTELPSDDQWKELQILATVKNDAIFIWEDVPIPELKKRMQEMELESVVIQPAANRTLNDWFSEQQSNLERLASCCQIQTK